MKVDIMPSNIFSKAILSAKHQPDNDHLSC